MSKRLLLKISGEALKGDGTDPIQRSELDRVCAEVCDGRDARERAGTRVDVAIVVGGGNIIRGAQVGAQGGDPCRGDYMGMLATLINALALQDGFAMRGQACEVVAPYAIPNVAHAYDRRQVQQWLDERVIVVFGGGTGHPFFTTDTTAALRAVEIGASELLKGSNVDGIYTADPKKDPTATRYEQLSFEEVLLQRFAVMDQTAFALCREHNIGIRVFDMTDAGMIAQSLSDHPPGTIVKD